MQTVWSIQYLRALAAIAVVLVHAFATEGIDFHAGGAGVDLFFVISGFIMWTLTRTSEAAPASFAWRRIVRIVPLYWAMTLATVAILVIRPNFLVHTDINPTHVLQSLLFVPYANNEGGVFPVVVQGWTLNYEMFFYALVAVMLFAPETLRFWGLSAALSLLVLIGLIVKPQGALLQTYTDPMLLEFLGGVWLGRAWEKGWLRGGALGWSAIALGAGALIAQYVLDLSWQPRALMWGLPALLIVAGALMLERSGAVAQIGSLRLLGDASYAIYLVHGLLAGFINWFLPATIPGLRGGATLIGSIIVGIFIFKLFERPVTRLLRNPPKLARA